MSFACRLLFHFNRKLIPAPPDRTANYLCRCQEYTELNISLLKFLKICIVSVLKKGVTSPLLMKRFAYPIIHYNPNI
jgi:hypothetical protein